MKSKKKKGPRCRVLLKYLLLSVEKNCHKNEMKKNTEQFQNWVHKTSLSPQLFINVPVPKQESERSCICVSGLSIFPLFSVISNSGLLWLGTQPILFNLTLPTVKSCWYL
jgi:hypothetical protein